MKSPLSPPGRQWYYKPLSHTATEFDHLLRLVLGVKTNSLTVFFFCHIKERQHVFKNLNVILFNNQVCSGFNFSLLSAECWSTLLANATKKIWIIICTPTSRYIQSVLRVQCGLLVCGFKC